MAWLENLGHVLTYNINTCSMKHVYTYRTCRCMGVLNSKVNYMLSILTKRSGCYNKKNEIFLILIKQVMTNLFQKTFSVLAPIFTKLWPIYELHNYIILIIIINIINILYN